MNKAILRLAIPNIISNITVPLLGLVDMAVVGHLDSESYIAAIAVAVTIFNFIYWNFGFLRMGTSGFAAQAYGAGDKFEQANILLRSLFVAFLGGLLLISLQFLILKLGFFFFEVDPNVRSYVSDYFHIYIWAAPAVLGLYAINGWYVGMQDAITPMFIAIGINIVNIGLCLLLVFGFKMKLEGVATAALCAQYGGLITSLWLGLYKHRYLKSFFDFSVLKKISDFVPFFRVNTNIFLRTLALITVSTFFVSASSRLGTEMLAVNALMMQMFTLFSYLMDGFAYSGEALTGKFIGRKDYIMLKPLVRSLFKWGFVVVVCFTSVYAFGFDFILSILTDKANVISLAHDYKFWVLLIPIAGFSAFLWDGIFVGATASRQMRNSMLIAMLAFFAIYYGFSYIVPEFFQTYTNNILWFAFISYLCVRGIVQLFMSRRIFNFV